MIFSGSQTNPCFQNKNRRLQIDWATDLRSWSVNNRSADYDKDRIGTYNVKFSSRTDFIPL